MRKCGIYGFLNTINGKWYVGQSVNVCARKENHLYYLRRSSHFNVHLQSAFIKYGEKSFEFRILEETTQGMLDVREKAWIKQYNSRNPLFGYNIEKGGNSYKSSYKQTDLTTNKSKRGGNWTPERRYEFSQMMKERHQVKKDFAEIDKGIHRR